LILHQVDGIPVEFVQQGASVLLRKMLKAPLQHAASIRMGGQVENIAAESVDEGEAVGRYTFNQFLDHLQKAGSATLKLYHTMIFTWFPFASLTHLKT
jgi:hypothetical protein